MANAKTKNQEETTSFWTRTKDGVKNQMTKENGIRILCGVLGFLGATAVHAARD